MLTERSERFRPDDFVVSKMALSTWSRAAAGTGNWVAELDRCVPRTRFCAWQRCTHSVGGGATSIRITARHEAHAAAARHVPAGHAAAVGHDLVASGRRSRLRIWFLQVGSSLTLGDLGAVTSDELAATRHWQC